MRHDIEGIYIRVNGRLESVSPIIAATITCLIRENERQRAEIQRLTAEVKSLRCQFDNLRLRIRLMIHDTALMTFAVSVPHFRRILKRILDPHHPGKGIKAFLGRCNNPECKACNPYGLGL